MFFPNSAIFIEKNWVENRLWGKSAFLWEKKMYHTSRAGREATSRANVYEINQWLWQFGRGKPRLGGLSVAETEELCIAVAKGGAKRAVVTRARRSCKALKPQGGRGLAVRGGLE